MTKLQKQVLFLGFIVWNLFFANSQATGQAVKDTSGLDWFKQAKFGIFLHWGVFSSGKAGASWPMFGGAFSEDEYMAQARQFTAQNYDPPKWAEILKESGAKYAVLTAMHCDGVALWPTQAFKSTSMQNISPYKKDLIGPYCYALKKAGLKVGLYYSHADWSNDDYMTLTQNITQKQFDSDKKIKYNYQKNWELENKEDYFSKKTLSPQEKLTWNRFIKRHDDQVEELVSNYKVDLLWFDFMYPNTGDFKWGEKQLRAKLSKEHPSLVVNGRMGSYGDYETPEKGLPIIPPQGPWELCETLNDNWSYVANDHNNKSVREVLRMLVECVSMGGNLLLGIGPRADGSLEPEQEKRILEVGRWIKNHEEAIYNTQAGILPGHFYGPTALSTDKKTLYLYLFDDPKDGIHIRGIRNRNIKNVAIVGKPNENLNVKYSGGASWAGIPPILNISIPSTALDNEITVVKIEMNEPIDLYRGKGKDIINN